MTQPIQGIFSRKHQGKKGGNTQGFCKPKMRVSTLTTPSISQIELSLDFFI